MLIDDCRLSLRSIMWSGVKADSAYCLSLTPAQFPAAAGVRCDTAKVQWHKVTVYLWVHLDGWFVTINEVSKVRKYVNAKMLINDMPAGVCVWEHFNGWSSDLSRIISSPTLRIMILWQWKTCHWWEPKFDCGRHMNYVTMFDASSNSPSTHFQIMIIDASNTSRQSFPSNKQFPNITIQGSAHLPIVIIIDTSNIAWQITAVNHSLCGIEHTMQHQ